MKGAVSCLRPPPEIVPETFNVFGMSTSDEILFSVHSADERSAEQVTSVASTRPCSMWTASGFG